MSIRKRRHREKFTEPDLTSFMNLMVIMIPSLLINAVFTQVSILNVDQPGDGGVNLQLPGRDCRSASPRPARRRPGRT